jgi:cysteine desulfuration protein SufE
MKLDELLAEFDGALPDEALELLIDLGDALPPVSPQRAAAALPAECRVEECQTAVYLWVDVVEGRLWLEAVVPEQSPTVRGFVSLLVQGLTDEPAELAAGIPDDLLPRLGLDSTLGMQRRAGFRGILARIKREAARGVATGREAAS